MLERHGIKGRGGMGGCRAPGFERKRMERGGRIKPVSKKQAVRNDGLREKREKLLNKMHEVTGMSYCMADPLGVKCYGRLALDHVTPRGRHPENVDGFGNLQILCARHHGEKTYKPGMQAHDYRTPEMKKMCEELE